MNYDSIIYHIALNSGFNSDSAKLVVAQARLESNAYTSNLFKQNNNLFGVKYVGQPLATRGLLVPLNERSSGDPNTNYYAKYKSPEDSAKDVIERLYQKTINGITPMQIQMVRSPEEFAEIQQKRGYFGSSAELYARMLKAQLLKVRINELFSDIKQEAIKNKDILEISIFLICIAGAYLLLNR